MSKDASEKTIRLDLDLLTFNRLLFWALEHERDSEEHKLLYKILEDKLRRMIDRDLYHKYKTAPTEELREAARLEYIERRGILPDFRW